VKYNDWIDQNFHALAALDLKFAADFDERQADRMAFKVNVKESRIGYIAMEPVSQGERQALIGWLDDAHDALGWERSQHGVHYHMSTGYTLIHRGAKTVDTHAQRAFMDILSVVAQLHPVWYFDRPKVCWFQDMTRFNPIFD
jgi:hypothetical protein